MKKLFLSLAFLLTGAVASQAAIITIYCADGNTVDIEIPKKSKTEPDSVRQSKYEGIENYLGYIYRPLLRRKLDLEKDEKYPNKTPREVNLLSNEYFKTSPVSEESTPYDINLDNWDEYRKAFCKWAEEQHGEDFVKPQKEDNH